MWLWLALILAASAVISILVFYPKSNDSERRAWSSWYASVRMTTSRHVNLSNPPSVVNDQLVVLHSTILLRGQHNSEENGVYWVSKPTVWLRAACNAQPSQVREGTRVWVETTGDTYVLQYDSRVPGPAHRFPAVHFDRWRPRNIPKAPSSWSAEAPPQAGRYQVRVTEADTGAWQQTEALIDEKGQVAWESSQGPTYFPKEIKWKRGSRGLQIPRGTQVEWRQ